MANEQSERPTNRLTPTERYHRDAAFHALVDTLRGVISQGDYTPTELREAVILACVIHERYRPTGPIFLEPDLDRRILENLGMIR